MNDTLDKKLCESYPKIFANRHSDMRDTAMCWGFECGDGWYSILDQLCDNIQHHIDWKTKQRALLLEKNPHNIPIPDEVQQVVAVQVKEKFGTLRFYYEGGDEVIHGMVNMAESMSSVMCEVCGNPGKQTKVGWIRTLCETHNVD